MIVDIRFNDGKPPIQIQGVRLITCYPRADKACPPEFVIHFTDVTKPTQYVEADTVFTFSITND